MSLSKITIKEKNIRLIWYGKILYKLTFFHKYDTAKLAFQKTKIVSEYMNVFDNTCLRQFNLSVEGKK